jgi:hypothetical protein
MTNHGFMSSGGEDPVVLTKFRATTAVEFSLVCSVRGIRKVGGSQVQVHCDNNKSHEAPLVGSIVECHGEVSTKEIGRRLLERE